MQYFKYHGLGNDYLVQDPVDCPLPSDRDIRVICHRNFGLGSDGILYGPLPSKVATHKLRILNPDASEAEKSGNGLRIFARYLVDRGYQAEGKPFTVETLGGVVTCLVDPGNITVDMGKVSFDAARIPVKDHRGEVLNAVLDAAGESITFCAATVGNPHCVVILDAVDEALARRLGPLIERHPLFPHRTNVQFVKVIDRKCIQIEIWERGAGYTLASGSSSSAAGAVAHRLGLVDGDLTVRMPGGTIHLHIAADFSIRMTGPAARVGSFQLDTSCISVAPDAIADPL